MRYMKTFLGSVRPSWMPYKFPHIIICPERQPLPTHPYTRTHTHTTLWPDFYQWQMITMRRASEPQSGLKLKAEADDDVCPIFNNLPMTTLMWRSLLCWAIAWPDVGLTKCRVRGIRSRLHYRCEILKTLLARCAAGGGRQNEQLLRRMRCVLKDTAQRE